MFRPSFVSGHFATIIGFVEVCLYGLLEEHLILSCFLDFCALYPLVLNTGRKVQSTQSVSYRHRLNTYQSVTESSRYQVSGAVSQLYQHRVNGNEFIRTSQHFRKAISS